jgi:hypothetical protein
VYTYCKYVGQAQQKCSQGMNGHKLVIKHFPDTITSVQKWSHRIKAKHFPYTITNVPEHFNSEEHSIKDNFVHASR